MDFVFCSVISQTEWLSEDYSGKKKETAKLLAREKIAVVIVVINEVIRLLYTAAVLKPIIIPLFLPAEQKNKKISCKHAGLQATNAATKRT